MDLLLQSTAQAPGGSNSVSGKQSEGVPSADFSRVLARQSQGQVESRPDGQERNSTVNDRPGDEAPAGTERSLGIQGKEQEQETHLSSLPGAEGPFSEAALAWASLAGVPASIEPLGMPNFTGPTMMGTQTIPAHDSARLAGEISSQFINRNGMQTLILQLEPDHLGKVEVHLQARGDQLSVRLMADNREAETALRQNIKELTEAIQERTGKYNQVDVRVELKSQNDSGNKNADGETPPDDTRQHAGKNSQGSSQGDPELGNGGNTSGDNNPETASDQWAQGG